MSLVVNKTLAGIKLAPGLSIYQELWSRQNYGPFSVEFKLTTSDPSMASPPLVVDASPKGSSFGSRSGLRRAIHLSSPTDGSVNRLETASLFRVGENGKATFSNVSRHMNSRVTIVDNEVLCQTVRLAGYLDIVTYRAKLTNEHYYALYWCCLPFSVAVTVALPRPDPMWDPLLAY